MNRNEYFKELRRTSDTVKPIVERYLDVFHRRCGGIWNGIFYLAADRTKKEALLLKPFLVRLSYEVSGGKNWEAISPICAATELINISSYQANIAFDGKYGLASEDHRNNQFIASMITREIALDIIYDMTGVIDSTRVEKIAHSLAEANKYIYLGQYYDLSILTRKSFDLSTDFSSYLKLYIERCDNLSGIFSEQCALIGGILSNAGEEEISALRIFGRNFGIGLHIVNDIGDFAPPSTITVSSLKKNYDQYNDLKQGKLTLPIMYILKFGDDAQRKKVLEVLGKHTVLEKDLIEITQIMIISGSISFSKRLAKDYMKKAKCALRIFEPSYARSLLSMMISQVRSNKYFAALRRFTDEGKLVG